MPDITPLFHLRRNGIPAEGPFQMEILVRLQAPDAPESAKPRSPLHLAVVLDRSGSMSGQPLREACRCAAAIMDRMGPKDRMALVAYDNRVRVLRPCVPLHDREEVRRILGAMDSGGNTDLHLGWTTGVAELQKAHSDGVISRVLLLSDGCANAGITDPDQLAAACTEAQSTGISTSTYGLGRRFEENLMTAMARHGQGRAYFGETAEDLLDPFMEEFDLLSNLVARKLTVSLKALPGVRISQLNDYLPAGPNAWFLPDLAYQAEAWALFRLEGEASLLPHDAEGLLDLVQVAVSWHGEDGVPQDLPTHRVRLPLMPSVAYGDLPEDPLVVLRAGELRSAELQEQAYQAARAGDWARLRALLDEMKAVAADNQWTQSVVQDLERLLEGGDDGMFMKELRFSSYSSKMRLTTKDETRDFMLPITSSYTRRKRRQGKSQDNNGQP